MSLNMNAIRPLVERYKTATAGRQMQLALAVAEQSPVLLAKVDELTAKLDKPCGSCHPCTNYRDETWRAANRKPPHVIEWDDAQAELRALREVVEAAKVWRTWYGEARPPFPSAQNSLAAALDALPNPAEHLDICPGYGCPGCLEAGVA